MMNSAINLVQRMVHIFQWIFMNVYFCFFFSLNFMCMMKGEYLRRIRMKWIKLLVWRMNLLWGGRMRKLWGLVRCSIHRRCSTKICSSVFIVGRFSISGRKLFCGIYGSLPAFLVVCVERPGRKGIYPTSIMITLRNTSCS